MAITKNVKKPSPRSRNTNLPGTSIFTKKRIPLFVFLLLFAAVGVYFTLASFANSAVTYCTGGCAGIVSTTDGKGYWQLGRDGGIFPFGNAVGVGALPSTKQVSNIVGFARTPTNQGYWVAGSDGSVFQYGDAVQSGNALNAPHNAPFVGIASTGNKAYWLLGSDGGIFPFGPVPAACSFASQPHKQPFVAIAARPDGQGYWAVGKDGNIFACNAGTYGSLVASSVSVTNVVGMASTSTGHGYWIVTADGKVFAYGDATDKGKWFPKALNYPIVGISATGTNQGYWLFAADGGLFPFGDATDLGHLIVKPPTTTPTTTPAPVSPVPVRHLEDPPSPYPTQPAVITCKQGELPLKDAKGNVASCFNSHAAIPNPPAPKPPGNPVRPPSNPVRPPGTSRPASPPRPTPPSGTVVAQPRPVNQDCSKDPNLSKGSTGNCVLELQKLLQSRGFYGGSKLDGKYGPGTEKAVRDYQASRGLPGNGSMNPQTWDFLRNNRGAITVVLPPASVTLVDEQQGVLRDTRFSGTFSCNYPNRNVCITKFTYWGTKVVVRSTGQTTFKDCSVYGALGFSKDNSDRNYHIIVEGRRDNRGCNINLGSLKKSNPADEFSAFNNPSNYPSLLAPTFPALTVKDFTR